MLPQSLKHARFAFRCLKPEARAEAVAERVCQRLPGIRPLSCNSARPSKTNVACPPLWLATACGGPADNRITGGHLNVLDVLSKYCQTRKDLTVDRLDKHDKDDENAWCEVLVEDRRAGPAETACVRLDFESWLKSLPVRHRKIAQYLSLGNRPSTPPASFA